MSVCVCMCVCHPFRIPGVCVIVLGGVAMCAVCFGPAD